MIKVWLKHVKRKKKAKCSIGHLPDVDEFLDDTLCIGDSVWPSIREDLHNTFDHKVNEVIKLDGIGSGKTTFVVLSLLYVLRLLGSVKDPAAAFGLMPGSKIAIVISSLREKQAKGLIFDDLKMRLDTSAWFRENYRFRENGGLEIEFPNRVFVISGSSSESVPIGYNVLVGVLDEGDWFLRQSHIGDATDQAENVYSAVKERIETRFGERGLAILVTSARQADGFMITRYLEVSADKYGYTTRRPYWESKPGRWYPFFEVRLSDLEILREKVFDYNGHNGETVLIPQRLKNHFKRNPRIFLRNRASVMLTSSNAYVLRPDLITVDPDAINHIDVDGVILPDFVPNDGVIYYSHNDLGYSQDKAVVSLGHQEDHMTVIDLVYVIDPKKEGKVDFEIVRQIFYQLQDRGFEIGLITFDKFNSLDTMQRLENRGFSVEIFSVDTDSKAYDAWLEAHYTETLIVPDVEGYFDEAKALITRGKRVDHRKGKSKDITDSIAGTVFHCREQGGDMEIDVLERGDGRGSYSAAEEAEDEVELQEATG